MWSREMYLVVRSNGVRREIVPAISAPNLTSMAVIYPSEIRTMDELLDESLVQQRLSHVAWLADSPH